ncbi:hypothetical protein [Thalassotalea litorea]|nr:hypothetical protein [Thalassotalea litorea]
MKELSIWWKGVPSQQKSGLIVLAAFCAGALIMMFAIEIGQAIAKLL